MTAFSASQMMNLSGGAPVFVRQITDDQLAQYSYLIGCQRTGEAIVFDPMRDIDRYVDLAKQQGLKIVAAAETHIHADFLSGLRELGELPGVKLFLSGEGDEEWTPRWLDQHSGGGSYDHRLLRDGEIFSLGNIDFRVLHTPGHTPEHLSFLVTDRGAGADQPMALISGDFLFVGDLGRPDLLETAAGHAGSMEPSARELFQSAHLINLLPEFVQVWPGHGSGSACGKALGAVPTSTIGYEMRFNSALSQSASEEEFVQEILSGQPEPPLYFSEMKRLNRDGVPVLEKIRTPKRMNEDQFVAAYESGAIVVDTRDWDLFKEQFLPGSLSIPMTSRLNSSLGSFLELDDRLLMVCREEDVDEMVRRLIRIGFDKILGWVHPDEIVGLSSYLGAWGTIEEVRSSDFLEGMEFEGRGILDVRKSSEFEEDHIPGAINISHTRLRSQLHELDKNITWYVICETGDRSARSSSFLNAMGWSVINLSGGMQGLRKGKVL